LSPEFRCTAGTEDNSCQDSLVSKWKCLICHSEPAFELSHEVFLCSVHFPMYSVWTCSSCNGRTIGTEEAPEQGLCRTCERKVRVSRFSTATIEQLEAFKTTYAVLPAIKFLMDTQSPRPSLGEAKELIAILGVTRAPVVKLNLDEIVNELVSTDPKPCAIEAIWDGDSSGWFVNVYAIFNAPKLHPRAYRERSLARPNGQRLGALTLRHGWEFPFGLHHRTLPMTKLLAGGMLNRSPTAGS
jgi:hypothetical protein